MIVTPSARTTRRKLMVGVFSVVVVTLIASLTYIYRSNLVAEATLAGFKAGDIMSDSVMGNKNTMNESQIQAFLKSKVNCSSKGDYSGGSYYYDKLSKSPDGKTAYLPNGTSWSIKDGHFVCMPDDLFNGESAARIIWQAAQDYNINPQVIIVLLQKEQGLITDGFPNSIQYRSATGYGCPDTAPCDSQYYGLKNQIRKAAALFREVLSGGWTNYPVGNNYVQYNPVGSCGGTIVNISNRATSALYRYTPYQPNQASLDLGYGDGAYCGAYGNRNFYNYFTDWFGSTHAALSMSTIQLSPTSQYIDAPLEAYYTITNYTKSTVNLGSLGIAVRDKNGLNVDLENSYVDNVTIAPGQTTTIRGSTAGIGGAEGQYNFFAARLANGAWHAPTFDDYGQAGSGEVSPVLTKKPTITSSLSVGGEIHQNELTPISFTVKNNSATYSVNLETLDIAARSTNTKDTTNYDIGWTENVTLLPGEERIISHSRALPAGEYRVWITNYKNSIGWNDNFPEVKDSGTFRSLNLTVKPQATIIEGVSYNVGVRAGNNTTASFKIKNFGSNTINLNTVGLAARSTNPKDTTNYDIGWTENVTLLPGEERIISHSRALPAGEYRVWVANYKTTTGWNNNYPESDTNTVARSLTIKVKQQATITEGVSYNTGVHAGNNTTASFKIKNFGDIPISLGTMGLAARSTNTKDTTNYDIGWTSDVTLAPGEERTFTYSKALPAGEYRVWVASYTAGAGWADNSPESESPSIARNVNVTVKDQITITGSLSYNTGVQAGQLLTASFKIKNFGTTPYTIDTVDLAARSTNPKNTTNYDIGWTENITLSPGEERTFTYSKALPAGEYRLWIASFGLTMGWNDEKPTTDNSSIVRSLTATVISTEN